MNILRRSNSSLTPDHLSSSHDSTTSGNNPTTNAPSYGNDPISNTPSYSYVPFTDAPSSHEGTTNNNQSITSESGNVDSDTTDSSNNPTTNAPLHTHTQYQSSPDGINAWSTITLDHSSLSNNASDVFSSVRTTIPHPAYSVMGQNANADTQDQNVLSIQQPLSPDLGDHHDEKKEDDNTTINI